MNKKDSLLSFGFHKESGQNISLLTLNPSSKLLCPECFESYTIEHKGYVEASLVNDKMVQTGEEPIDLNFATKVEYVCVCKTCGHMVTLIQVDEDLADAIRILNRNNYKTVAHCEGHSNDTVKRMYIKFTPDTVLPSIPDGWSLNGPEHSIEFKYSIEMQRDMALSNLYEWIHNISAKSEDGSDWNYEEWKKQKGD